MYAAHFGLKDQPFSITPDPAYLFMSPHHQEALAHLLYGTGDLGGFVQLTGEVGTGKTTLVRALAEQSLDRLEVALCLNPRLTVVEFVAALCDELGVDYPRDSTTLKPLVDALNRHLLATHARGRRTVLIIDEAQNLSREVLEQVRLLTNLETHRHKLLRIILVGQPELQRLLARDDMRQLAQRITARYHLAPLRPAETRSYILHRLRIAGARDGLFTAAALRSAHRLSRGIPRLVNIICDRALLAAYVQGQSRVDGALLRQAAREALKGSQPWGPPRWVSALAGSMAVVVLALGIWWVASDSTPLISQFALPTSPLPFMDSETESQPEDFPEQPTAALPPIAPAQDPSETAAEPPSPPALAALVDSSAEALVDSPTASLAETPGDTSDTEGVHPPSAMPSSPEQAMLAPPEPGTATTPQQPQHHLPDRLEPLPIALGRLLAVWDNRPWAGEATDCERLKTEQLFCLEGDGDLDTLRRFNRPAILTLNDTAGSSGQVLLRMVDGEEAVIAAGDQWQTLPIDLLESLWSGDYLLLWRPQAEGDFIGPGDRGNPVNWLRQRLAMIDGGPGATSSPRYDEALARRVRAFQDDQGLPADGLVGGQTMTLLNNLQPTPGTPLLVRER